MASELEMLDSPAIDGTPDWNGGSRIDVSIIVPTFLEVANLPILVPRVAAALEEAGLRGEMVVVDDNSQDGTVQVCRDLALIYPVRLIVRTHERGLSSAVLCGMRAAHGAILLVMDADLSHPPEKIADLVHAVRGGADFAIGSRYVVGGGTEDDWGLFRWLNSRAATLLAWPLTTARDPMAGFFALPRSTFQAAPHLSPIGYKIGLELMVKCGCRKIAEVPIHFRNRLHGTSKLSLKEQFNYVRHLKRLYEYRLGVIAKPLQFVLIGATGMVVDLSMFALLLMFLPLAAARALAIGVAMTWNFWLNRRLTFSYARHRPLLPQYLLFCLSCSVGALLNWSVCVALTTTTDYFAANPFPAAILGILSGTVVNYLASRYIAFGRQ